MIEPLVSFVVPCYRLSHYLTQCVESILEQTHRNIEVIIMDDCSPDDTPAVAAQLSDPRVIYVRNDKNLGHLVNYNAGIQASTGKYVWLISADDFLMSPDIVKKYVNRMEDKPTTAYIFSPATAVDGDGNVCEILDWTAPFRKDRFLKKAQFLRTLVYGNCVAAPSGMVRRSCYESAGAFPLDLPHAGDWYLWCRFAFLGDVAYLADSMVAYRKHAGAMSTNMNTMTVRDDQAEVRWRIRALAESARLYWLVKLCEKLLCQQYANKLATSALSDRNSTSAAVDSLLERETDKTRRERLKALIYEGLGDDCYANSHAVDATHYYRSALAYNPLQWVALAKLALLKLGRSGKVLRSAITGQSFK